MQTTLHQSHFTSLYSTICVRLSIIRFSSHKLECSTKRNACASPRSNNTQRIAHSVISGGERIPRLLYLLGEEPSPLCISFCLQVCSTCTQAPASGHNTHEGCWTDDATLGCRGHKRRSTQQHAFLTERGWGSSQLRAGNARTLTVRGVLQEEGGLARRAALGGSGDAPRRSNSPGGQEQRETS